MNYQILLNNGQVLVVKATDFNAETFTQTLNSREILFVNVGGTIVNKNMILSIAPSPEQTV